MLSNFISPADIKLNLVSTERDECLAELLELIVKENPQIKRSEAMNALLVREEKRSTAVFTGVAVPHGVCSSLKKTAVAIGISKKGIEFESAFQDNGNQAEDSVVNIIFEILFEENETQTHLQILRDVLHLVENPKFMKRVLECTSSREVFDLIASMES